MVLRINKRWIFFLIISIGILCSYSFDFLGFTIPQNALLSIILVFEFWHIFIQKKLKQNNSPLILFYKFLLIFAVISCSINGIKAQNITLSMLNFFLIPVFWLFFEIILNKREYIQNIFKLITVIFWLNLAFFVFQQFSINVTHQDNLCGIFGTVMGNDGFMNLLLIFYTVYVLLSFFSGKMSIQYTLIVIAICSYESAIGELKIYFIELLFVLFMIMLLIKISLRKILIFISVALIIAIGVYFLEKFYPVFRGFLSIDSLLDVLYDSKGYTGEGDISRFNGIDKLKDLLYPWQFMIGKGLENANQSSSFFQQYGNLHYDWFAYSYIFVELGILGVGTLIIGFILEGIKQFKLAYKYKNSERKVVSQLSCICSFLSLILLFYNIKTFTIIGAMLTTLMISLPYIYENMDQNTDYVDIGGVCNE